MSSFRIAYRNIADFLRISLLHFLHHDCLKSAAALSFTTLLSIVPIIALLLFSMSQFISSSESQLYIQNTLIDIFSPSAGQELQSKILSLAEQASKLRTFGISVLIITVLLGLNTIDLTINNIWNIKRTKRTFIKLMLYFIALMFMPVLITISLSISTFVLSVPFLGIELDNSFLNRVIVSLAPVTVTWIAFVCMYLWIPNTRVSVKSGVIGGAIAAILFESAKILFLVYVRNFPTYDLIYGAFAVLPLFCLWIYISWVIILTGAVFTYNLSLLKEKQ